MVSWLGVESDEMIAAAQDVIVRLRGIRDPRVALLTDLLEERTQVLARVCAVHAEHPTPDRRAQGLEVDRRWDAAHSAVWHRLASEIARAVALEDDARVRALIRARDRLYPDGMSVTKRSFHAQLAFQAAWDEAVSDPVVAAHGAALNLVALVDLVHATRDALAAFLGEEGAGGGQALPSEHQARVQWTHCADAIRTLLVQLLDASARVHITQPLDALFAEGARRAARGEGA